MTNVAEITVELESPNGPRVVAPNTADHDDIWSELPEGWEVHPDDWQNGVRVADGRQAYPLSRATHPAVSADAERPYADAPRAGETVGAAGWCTACGRAWQGTTHCAHCGASNDT